jgi:hypothetical protein
MKTEHMAGSVIIEYDPCGDFPAFDAGGLQEVNVEGICVRMIAELHGLSPQSGKAV